MLRDVIVNLLHNLGGRAEVDRYLAQYASETGPGAVIKVGGGLIDDDLDELASALVLLQHVGLAPVVIHGGGPQLTRELQRLGVEPRFVDGLRVTDDATLAAAQRVFQATGARLADAIEAKGCRARPIPTGVFVATATAHADLGHVGDVASVNADPIVAATSGGLVPILSPIGATTDGQLLNINADTAARSIATAFHAQKVIYLTPTGGIFDSEGRVIPAVDTALELDDMIAEGAVSGGMARKLLEIDALLAELGEHASVSITRPSKLARELFTHRGSGTLVRRGAPIRALPDGAGLDHARATELLESTFAKRLDPAYLGTLAGSVVYVGGDYTALAIVRPGESADYLDKIAISERAQGIGLGAKLWRRLLAEHPRLYWRSRSTNDANRWYLPRSDGMRRVGPWLVFWRGVDDWDTIESCVAAAASRPESFHAGTVSPEEIAHAT